MPGIIGSKILRGIWAANRREKHANPTNLASRAGCPEADGKSAAEFLSLKSGIGGLHLPGVV
jgi:hypothetical protein